MALFSSTCNAYGEKSLDSKVGHIEECRFGRNVCSIRTYTEFISIKRTIYIFGKVITLVMFASTAIILCEVPSYPSSLYMSQ